MSIDIERLVAAMQRQREMKGLSLRALSQVIGVSFSSLARIERREGLPDNNSIIRILEWLSSEGNETGLSFEKVALVHFRAEKNVNSRTMQCLLKAADIIKISYQKNFRQGIDNNEGDAQEETSSPDRVALSKPEMESMALQLRSDCNLNETDSLDALGIRIKGVQVFTPIDVIGLSDGALNYITIEANNEWSAMSVPLDESREHWAILRNNNHTIERQRVTYLEECWHILLGHKLTKIAKIADAYGRTYDTSEEDEAFYLAAATLLPEKAMAECVNNQQKAPEIGVRFGVSSQLVEYRIKRLGLWLKYKNKLIVMQ
jgi:transcriptional regulator with XRE-family HTH domain